MRTANNSVSDFQVEILETGRNYSPHARPWQLPSPHEIDDALLIGSTPIMPKVDHVGGSKPAVTSIPWRRAKLVAPVFLRQNHPLPEGGVWNPFRPAYHRVPIIIIITKRRDKRR
jgi:hypothetical protein